LIERRDGYWMAVDGSVPRSKAESKRYLPEMDEPGLDLHEWETRWVDLNEAAADVPDEALPEFVRYVEQMLVERGFQLDEPVTLEGEDFDVIKDFLAARDLAARGEKTALDREDAQVALENLRELHDYLVNVRAFP
jgi:hypothetical protein